MSPDARSPRRLLHCGPARLAFVSVVFTLVAAIVPPEQARAGATGVERSDHARAAVDQGGAASCVEDAETLCLNDGRFEVRAEWRDFEDDRGAGQAVPFTDDSGLFYFFDANNIEMLVKVLDGCGVNGYFWVFFAATTNVELTMVLRDTMTGARASTSIRWNSAPTRLPTPVPSRAARTPRRRSRGSRRVGSIVRRPKTAQRAADPRVAIPLPPSAWPRRRRCVSTTTVSRSRSAGSTSRACVVQGSPP